jgi:hypothetical protein
MHWTGPIAPLCSLPNVQYKLQDINKPFTRFADNSFDVVHARDIWLAVSLPLGFCCATVNLNSCQRQPIIVS